MAGGAILLAHAILLAVGPSPVLFLANHDHVVLGSVTPELWRLHVQFHLRQLDGHYMPPAVSGLLSQPDRLRITSLPGCNYDVLGTSTRSLAATPMIYAPGADGRQTQIGRVALPQVIDLSPDFAPIRPPPERTSS